MLTSRRIKVLIPLFLFEMACGGGEGSGPSPADISGTWVASSVRFTGHSGQGTVDIIAAGGSATLVLDANGNLTYTVTKVGGTPQVMTATYQIMGIDLMRITPSGGSWYWAWDMAFSGNSLHLWCNHAYDLESGMHPGYDFNHDGTWDATEEADWDLTFTR